MKPHRLFSLVVSRLLPGTFAFVLWSAGAHAIAQADPPGRVARLNHVEGSVTFAPAGDNEFTDAELNRPLTRGDRLWTEKGSRAEIQAGSAAVRMDGQTQLQLLALDDQSTQLSVTQGTVYVRVRSLPEGENFEVDTPNLAWRASYPGDYRIDVNTPMGTTRVTIHSGTGAVYGDKGQSLAMGGGQQITFRARTLAQVNKQESPPQDNFDRWAAERNRREDQSVAARYLPRELVGYQQLDTAGQWAQDATHGAVWFPQAAPANWAPFRNGRWEWIEPWGWTWIDEAPWGFATSHYGRWASINNRWGWVPGRMGLRPMFAPALVAFVGGEKTAGLPLGPGKQGVAWFPLAPGEAWKPGYRATPLYISTINSNMPPLPSGNYAYLRKPEAVTAIAADDFTGGKPLRGGVHLAGNLIAQAQVVPPPPMPERATRALAKAPSPSADIRPVANNNAAAAQQQAEAQRAREAQERVAREQEAAKAEQAKAEQVKAEQAKAEQVKAEQAKAEQVKAEQAKAEQVKAEQARAEQARLEQARIAQQAKLAEQAKAAQQAKAAEEARSAAQAKAEQARAEQARIAEQAKLADQQRHAERARLAEQKRVAEQASVAEQQGRAAAKAHAAQQQARAAEQARLAQQAHAEQARIAEQQRAAQQARQQEQLQARRADQARRETAARRAEAAKREQLARREQARREQLALAQAKREQVAAARAQAQRELQARRAEQARRVAAERKDEQARKLAHAQQVEAARRAAEQDAQALRDQRQRREDAARRQAEDRELAQREAWQRQQQAVSEQWRRDQQNWELQQQRERTRQRPDLRNGGSPAPQQPEIWQRGIPILNPGRTS